MPKLRGINGATYNYGEITEVLRVGPFEFSTVQAAVTAAPAGAVIEISPGTYAETVTIPYAKKGLRLVGMGSFCDVVIAASVEGSSALVVEANNVTIENLNLIGKETHASQVSSACLVSGDQFRAFGCRFEMNADYGIGLRFQAGKYDDYTADPPTCGSASIARVEGCEFCWAETGVLFDLNDGLTPTQNLIQGCQFRNLSVACIGEDGDTLTALNVMVKDCLFENGEDGTAPTDYIDLDATGNTGVLAGNWFAAATHEADVIQLAAGVLYVANYAVVGVSTGAPD